MKGTLSGMSVSNHSHSFVMLHLIFGLIMSAMVSCDMNTNSPDVAARDEYFTCSMDPQVVENQAGNCPICHMKLIRVKKNNLKAGQIQLSEQQVHLANIAYDTVRQHEIGKEITLTGKVMVDQNLSDAFSAKVPGRIDKLIARIPGDLIKKGDLLFEIYSEELNQAQAEYLYSLGKNNGNILSGASLQRLRLYGLTEEQIRAIKTRGKIFEYVPVYAPRDAVLGEISVTEGDYVREGSTLFRLFSLESLWVEAQVYLPYLEYLRLGTKAGFFIPAAGETAYQGEVIFIDPQIQAPQRYVLARFQLKGSLGNIKPGMLANITMQTEVKRALTLPPEAIIQNSRGANVWVRNPGGIFENRMVKTGVQNNHDIEITGGLSEGELVVTSGAYLLNSEYIFKNGSSPDQSESQHEFNH